MGNKLKYKEVFAAILESKLPFVLYKKPEDEKVYGLLQKDINLWFVKDFEKDKGFVFSPFKGQDERILLKSDARLEFDMESFEQSSIGKSFNFNQLFSDKVEGPDMEVAKREHIALVQKAVDHIKNGNLKKVVIARSELWKAAKVDFASIFKDLVSKYNDAFVYIWFHPLVGMWIGASPELFLEKDEDFVHSNSLAATKLSSDDRNWETKEINEQKIVSDYIENVFEKNMLNSVKSFGPETVTAGKLQHLKTEITGYLSEFSNFNYLVNQLHPTPAVCGQPLDASAKFIAENENFDRYFYTGFLGELNIDNHSEFYVNLRCLQIVREGLKFFVGGGITIDSDPVLEWEETVNKSQTLKDVVIAHLT